MDPWLLALTQICILAYAALGGVFLAFSDFIMRALARSPGGAEAMQSINREVFRVVFMALFLSMVPVSLILAIGAWMTAPAPVPFLVAAALYVLGCFAVTAAGNVPLNNRLAGMDAATPEAQGWWQAEYGPRWTRLNTVRTLACFASAWLLLGALA
ncbi:MAG: anthrone oxygenase family protein [Pseudomonadota bacterium]